LSSRNEFSPTNDPTKTNQNQPTTTMLDTAYIIASIGFFVLMLVFIKICEKI